MGCNLCGQAAEQGSSRASGRELRENHRWHLINGEYDENDNTPDEHAEFVRCVREFHCDLLRQFEPASQRHRGSPANSFSVRLSEASGNTAEDSDGTESESSGGSEDSDDTKSIEGSTLTGGLWRGAVDHDQYIAQFAQPYPARPVWAALPQTASSGTGPELTILKGNSTWPSDFDCAPLVAVVLRDGPENGPHIAQTLSSFACHPAGLLVNLRRVREPDLVFAVVGLRPPPKGAGISGFITHGMPNNDRLLSRAEQRQMVWAAVHEVLQELEGIPGELVADVYMLRSVYLYDRLFRWLARKKSWDGPLRSISQEELDLLVHEFGEETATHFLFVSQYTRHLRVAAVASLFCMLITILDSQGWIGDPGVMENMKRTLLVAFLPAWGFHFLASWRSAASRAGFRWLGSLSSVQNSVKQVARFQAMESASEQTARYLRVLALSVPLMFLQVVIVFLVTVTFVCFEVYIYDVVWEMMNEAARLLAFVLYNVAFGIAFILMLGLFHPVSKTVTRWERHPDRDVAEWHLTAKIYANWFLAVFLYFFVIAFCYIPFGDSIADGIARMYAESEGHIAHVGNHTHTAGTAGEKHKYSIHGALQAFRPDLHRLAVDVALFFVLQDAARLMQVMVPIIRAAWGLGKLKGVKHKRHRQKRRAILSAFIGMFRFRCFGRSSALSRRGGRLANAAALALSPGRKHSHSCDEEDGEASSSRGSPKSPAAPATSAAAGDQPGGVFVLYCFLENIEVQHSRNSPDDLPQEEAFMFGNAVGQGSTEVVQFTGKLEVAGRGGHPVTSRLRVCYAHQRRSCLAEDMEDAVGDLLTLTVDPAALLRATTAASAGSPKRSRCGALRKAQDAVRARRRNNAQASRRHSGSSLPPTMEGEHEDSADDASDSEGGLSSEDEAVVSPAGLCDCSPTMGGQNQGFDRAKSQSPTTTPMAAAAAGLDGIQVVRAKLRAEFVESSKSQDSRWDTFVELPLRAGATVQGELHLGPIRAAYTAGLVHGRTRCEALGRVPRALRLTRAGREEKAGEEPPLELAAQEEARAMEDGQLPWLWWDQELSGMFWEEVFELFAVKETFETFELYAHLTTQFSYVSLFGIAVPICPLLAWLFTSVEVRQDQLRLLWLSRPPHPHAETLRFKRTVSLGAWYTIIRFTCHMSVIVNLLLWGLTYSGLSSRPPAEWSDGEWWRAVAIFLVAQQACFFLGAVLHRGVSQLDHDTAAAYLRRCSRLQHVLRIDEDDNSPTVTRRQASRDAARKRLTRSPSRGLSSLA